MSIRRPCGKKKQAHCNTYDFQKFLHGFPISLFQIKTETVQAYTVNWIFQRIRKYVPNSQTKLLLSITFDMISW
ncbi:hypothetical protein LEP1GSC193_4397 [Leptospira alstonii serovar Pingchang str. 80-412]|uniref:Uncharacterized protein n=2 Tax=Leptospira alstonii TaxID=28452 RepID=M6D1G2_9LEPT|nr:hypothetical protein LEP1GSC194_0586 [Leptospira alstonii serovar Sichuan str. 79601]EQA80372.1 hypothetical protein LEP1GSC193_4397 [Leptospira alstonii serovar Pingchang str. 80-412]